MVINELETYLKMSLNNTSDTIQIIVKQLGQEEVKFGMRRYS